MKKGIMEMTDLIVINKADGDNEQRARRTMREYRRILNALQPVSPSWTTSATTVSSINQIGIEEIWKTIKELEKLMKENEYWETRREEHTSDWFRERINDRLIDSFFSEHGTKAE